MKRYSSNIRKHAQIIVALTLMMHCCMSVSAQKKKGNAVQITQPAPVTIVSYELLENGDTINRLDSKHLKQGKWVIEHEAHHEEPGFLEVGVFENDLRTGSWKSYSMQGELQSIETYKLGLKDGEARYYQDGELFCVGNYMALNARQVYDTVMVEDAVTNVLKPVRIKTDVGSIKHGTWSFYDLQTHQLNRLLEYQADEVTFDQTYLVINQTDSLEIIRKMKSFPHITHKPDENVWLGKTGQKRIRYTDFPDNTQSVKPNVRKPK